MAELEPKILPQKSVLVRPLEIVHPVFWRGENSVAVAVVVAGLSVHLTQTALKNTWVHLRHVASNPKTRAFACLKSDT